MAGKSTKKLYVCSHCGSEFIGTLTEHARRFCGKSCQQKAKYAEERAIANKISGMKGRLNMSDAAIAKKLGVSERQIFRLRYRFGISALDSDAFFARKSQAIRESLESRNRCAWPKVDTKPSQVFHRASFACNVAERDFRMISPINPFHEVRSSIGCASAMAAEFSF